MPGEVPVFETMQQVQKRESFCIHHSATSFCDILQKKEV